MTMETSIMFAMGDVARVSMSFKWEELEPQGVIHFAPALALLSKADAVVMSWMLFEGIQL